MVEQQLFLEVVNPTAEYQDVNQVVASHARRPGSILGKNAVLLAAEKSSSPPFMQALVQRMIAETSVRQASMQNPDWPFFHPERAKGISAAIDSLVNQVDFMIVGVAY